MFCQANNSRYRTSDEGYITYPDRFAPDSANVFCPCALWISDFGFVLHTMGFNPHQH